MFDFVSPLTLVKPCAEKMINEKLESPVVAYPSHKLVGLIELENIVNYLGGGKYFNIIVEKYSYNVYSAFEAPLDYIVRSRDTVGENTR